MGTTKTQAVPGLLRDARVYLSGPMDFVASREEEMKFGWRARIGGFLTNLGVTVFDPWHKPEIHGLHEYGRETPETTRTRDRWTFAPDEAGARARSDCADTFWPALHIDLRIVDTTDFVIAYVPTNIYSVGTVHEIVLARTQRKPVLFVSPKIDFPSLAGLQEHLTAQGDKTGLGLLEQLKNEVPIKTNPKGAPSLWYLPLIGAEHFFDGFGFAQYPDLVGKEKGALDEHEQRFPPEKPLLPFLEALNQSLPEKWDRHLGKFGPNDDWLLWEFKKDKEGKTTAADVRG